MADSYDDEYAQTTESRKRPYGGDDGGNARDAKRSQFSQSQPLLKVLIPNYAAGAIIGKGGTNIGEIQNRYGAKIRLSPSREYYPGTEERIVVITGEISQIIDMNNYIIDKVHVENPEPNQRRGDDDRGSKVKIVVPNTTAGLVIGRGGAVIKALQEDTKAKVFITSRDDNAVHGERVIVISGNTEQRTEAARQVINKIAADAENMANRKLTYSSRNGEGNMGAGSGMGMLDQGFPNNLSALSSVLGNFQHQSGKGNIGSHSNNSLFNQSGIGGASNIQHVPNLGFGQNIGSIVSNIKTAVTIQMEIPDVLVGSLLGKHGKTVQEFMQFSGAKIQFSSKNDFAPGTTDRILSIQGDLNQTQIAYFLINQKITQAETELASGLLRR